MYAGSWDPAHVFEATFERVTDGCEERATHNRQQLESRLLGRLHPAVISALASL